MVIPPLMLFKEIFQMYTKMNYFDTFHPNVLIIKNGNLYLLSKTTI